MSFSYLRADDIRLINQSFCGPGAGVRDENGFEGIVERPQQTFLGRDLFPTVFMKGAAYLHGFATTQYFLDGNKRTGFLSATVFLALHDWQWVGPGVDDAESFLLDVADNKIDHRSVTRWLLDHSERRPLFDQLRAESASRDVSRSPEGFSDFAVTMDLSHGSA